MESSLREKYWHKFFELGVFLKGFNGIWEMISGLLILFFNKLTFSRWFYLLSRNELLEDPNDRFINFLAAGLQNLTSSAKTFAAIYVLFHGILNIFLAINLYRAKRWAYPVTIGLMLFFMTYQIYRIAIHHSLVLTAITVFDALFVILAWHEYKYHNKK